MNYTIAVISDTHGLLRHETLSYIESADLVIHAGDIGGQDVLVDLNALKTTAAVLGNVDYPSFYPGVTYTNTLEVHSYKILVVHNIEQISFDPATQGYDLVIFGHTHKPADEINNNVRYFNPGSAGPRRFSLPVSMGIITLTDQEIEAQHIQLIRSGNS